MSDENYTPEKYIESVRNVFKNDIDLDPCSCPTANEVVDANNFWTKDDNFLSKSYSQHSYDNAYMNPPYSRSAGTAGPYVAHLKEWYKKGSVKEAMVLLNVVTGNKWFQQLWDFPMCFVSPRISFLDVELNPQTSPRYDNVFIYMPHTDDIKGSIRKFRNEFSQYGHVTNLKMLYED